jgi:hypothetical protein
MNVFKKLVLFCVLSGIFTAAHAQIEVAHLTSKGYSALGFGGYLNFAIPVTEVDAVIVEGGLYVFSNNGSHEAVAPVLLGYRRLLDDSGYGLYLEPVAGYSFGGSDIQKYDSNGNALYKPNGNEDDVNVTGATAGMGFGYLFQPSGRIQFNISLRYEHVFVQNDPQLNIISLRISHSFGFGKREL